MFIPYAVPVFRHFDQKRAYLRLGVDIKVPRRNLHPKGVFSFTIHSEQNSTLKDKNRKNVPFHEKISLQYNQDANKNKEMRGDHETR